MISVLSRRFQSLDIGGVAGRDGLICHPLRFRSSLATLVPPPLGAQSRDPMADVLGKLTDFAPSHIGGTGDTFWI
jgi:hypothetical protein